MNLGSKFRMKKKKISEGSGAQLQSPKLENKQIKKKNPLIFKCIHISDKTTFF